MPPHASISALLALLAVYALLAASGCARTEPGRPGAGARPPAAVLVGQASQEDGCKLPRASCDAERSRCEQANVGRGPTDADPLLVPCDLVYESCLGRCKPGRAPP